MTHLMKFAQYTQDFVSVLCLSGHNFLELLGVYTEYKRVVRLSIDIEQYPIVTNYCNKVGFICGHAQLKQAIVQQDSTGDIFTLSVDWDDPRGRFVVIIIGKYYPDVQDALYCENRDSSFREFGILYQYPTCCVESYYDLEQRNNWTSALLSRTPIKRSYPYIANRLGALFDGSTLTPDYFPCSLCCEATIEIGQYYADSLNKIGWSTKLQLIQQSLRYPILVRAGVLLQIRNYKVVQGAGICYDPKTVLVINWQGRLPPNDIFWTSDTIYNLDQRLEFFVDHKKTFESSDRLLFFH